MDECADVYRHRYVEREREGDGNVSIASDSCAKRRREICTEAKRMIQESHREAETDFTHVQTD